MKPVARRIAACAELRSHVRSGMRPRERFVFFFSLAGLRKPMNRTVIIIGLLIVAAGAASLMWWQQQQTPPPAEVAAPAVEPPVAEPQKEDESAIKYPIESVAPEQEADAAPDAAQVDDSIDAGLIDLLGRDAVASFLRVTEFPLRVTATVDNLGRSLASAKIWPVIPASGRFTVNESASEAAIADENSERYVPFVRFVESVDTKRAVALYKKHYAQFQHAYEELGYPDGYFNDRLVAVIDNLLATPDPAGPLKVKLTELKDESERVRPWVHYRYVDPELEALSAGQKMMLRMGPDNRQRLKAKLREIRPQVTGQAMSPS